MYGLLRGPYSSSAFIHDFFGQKTFFVCSFGPFVAILVISSEEGLKKTQESVTTFHLGLPPPLVWPELGEKLLAFIASFYYIRQTMTHISVIFSMF